MNADQRREAERLVESVSDIWDTSKCGEWGVAAVNLLKQLLATPPASEVTAEEVQKLFAEDKKSYMQRFMAEWIADFCNSRVSAAVEAAVRDIRRLGIFWENRCMEELEPKIKKLEQQLAARPPLTPVKGPPDLEGPQDHEWCLVWEKIGNASPFIEVRRYGTLRTWNEYAISCIYQHQRLGHITPPSPEPELPRCIASWCDGTMSQKAWSGTPGHLKVRMVCPKCGCSGPPRDTEAEAIAAGKEGE